MSQKLLIAGLAVAIIAVIGFGLFDAAQLLPETVEPVQPAVENAAADTVPDVPPTPVAMRNEPQATPGAAGAVGEPQPQALDTMGDPWQATGTVTVLDDFGFTLATAGGEFFVELGPPDYWQAQDITLAEGDVVDVDGYYNGEQVHARVVTANGAELVIRAENGQPMWAGGVSNAGTGNAEGQHSESGAQVQVSPEDWLTLSGMLGSVSNSSVTLNVNDGTSLNLQMGQPRFWQSQGITLSVGDPVEVLGFWSGGQFMAGEIRKTQTGETIMLRDPNGRQLWAGPGRSGNQGSASQDGGAQGNGNQYRGGH